MIKAALLDLDSALLRDAESGFGPAFRRLWHGYFRAEYGINNAVDALLAGLQSMGRDLEGLPTSLESLVNCLSALTPLSHDEAAEAARRFYAECYGDLQPLATPVDGADALIESLLEQGLLVAVATQSLYPESAVWQRLDWAGLAGYIDDLAFIAQGETMRFAKRQPEYYAEAVARLGIEPDEALVVAGGGADGLRASAAIGCPGWHVDEDGSVADLLEQLQGDSWRESQHAPELKPAMIAPQYRGNMAALRGLLAESTPCQWQQRPDPDEWSIMQIVCHLWTTETVVHQARLRRILADVNPFLAALPPPGPHVPPCHDDADAILRRFCSDRRATLAVLAGVREAQWARPARHSIFGMTTLLEMAQFTAQHDRLHIAQLCQTLGKCADEAALR